MRPETGNTSPSPADFMRLLSASLRSSSAPGARLTGWVALALVVLTLAVFAPSMLNGFVDWDDEINLTRNLRYRGFTATHIHWILTNMLMGHYIPVTWTSFAIDHAIWGMNPVGYHLTNVVLHGVNVVLAFWLGLVSIPGIDIGPGAATTVDLRHGRGHTEDD